MVQPRCSCGAAEVQPRHDRGVARGVVCGDEGPVGPSRPGRRARRCARWSAWTMTSRAAAGPRTASAMTTRASCERRALAPRRPAARVAITKRPRPPSPRAGTASARRRAACARPSRRPRKTSSSGEGDRLPRAAPVYYIHLAAPLHRRQGHLTHTHKTHTHTRRVGQRRPARAARRPRGRVSR